VSAASWPGVGSVRFPPSAAEYLRTHAISASAAKSMGIRYLTALETASVLGLARYNYKELEGGSDSLAFPFDGDEGVVRLLHPDAPKKFLAPDDWKPRVTLHSPRLECARVRRDPKVGIAIAEGPGKGGAHAHHTGVPTISGNGLDGCGNAKKPIANFVSFVWKGREVTILVDSDAAAKPAQKQAIRRLWDYLVSLGASPRLRIIPALDGAEKTDVNDFLFARGAKALGEIPLTGIPDDWGAHAATAELNERLAFVTNGKAEVITVEQDLDFPGTRFVSMSRVPDLRLEYANQLTEVGKKRVGDVDVPQKRSKFDLWLADEYRREAKRIWMRPGAPWGLDPQTGEFNIWSGWAVEPAPPGKNRSWSRLRAHVSEVIACGDKAIAKYVLDWMAHGVQHPATLPEVALVLTGGEGTGKGTLAKALGRLYGRHFKHLEKPGALTDRFNDQMKDKLLVFADENFYAGDHAAASALKTMISEPTMTIEAKFANPYTLPNYRRFIIASNESWVIPAGPDARRYAVFQVSEHRRDDHAYFRALFGELEAGGYEAMLHDLMRRDISGFDPRRFPQTQALFDQKKLAFDHATRWWFECLCRGACHDSTLVPAAVWPKQILSSHPVEQIVSAGGVSVHEQRGLETKVGIALKKLCPTISKPRPSVAGKRQGVYLLPPLDECRRHFERYTRSRIDWETGELSPEGAK